MRHSVGLIRDWLRWYGGDPELQASLDASWPNWLECPSDEIAVRHMALTLTRMDQCTLPPLLTCTQDSDCMSGDTDHDLVCLQNNNDENNEGICAKRNTCYQHAHCPDDMLALARVRVWSPVFSSATGSTLRFLHRCLQRVIRRAHNQ